MTDYFKVAQGMGIFFLGLILTISLQYLVPPLVDSISGIYDNESLIQYSYFAMIFAVIIFMILLPGFFIVQAINTENDFSKELSILFGVIYLFLGIVISVKMWFIVPQMASLFEGTFLMTIFYVGMLLVWITAIFVAPLSDIVNKYMGGGN